MKKGDTRKLSKEGNNALTLEKVIVRGIFLTLFLVGFLHSQTNLNNFGVSEIVNTYKGYKKFTLLDFNKDGIDDLFLFGNQQKNFVIHKGLANSTFSEPNRKFFFFPIDDFKWLTKSKQGEDYYIFASRNKRLIGLVSFTKSKSLQLLHTIEYKSYPSSIKIVDLDLDGKNEALIYGDNFNGIELVENDGFRLRAKKIIDEMIIRGIDTIDSNQDQNIDFVVIDLLHNSLKFVENLGDTNFTISREINFEEAITKVKSEYFNNDMFVDLIVAKESGLEILIGDSVLSFSERINLNYPFHPSDFLIQDMNSDNAKELILINSLGDQFVVTIGIDSVKTNLTNNFDGISEINLLKNTSSESLVVLSNKGKIKIISAENKWGDSFSFSVGGIPNKIDFHFRSDGSFSFLIQDQLENSIDFIKADTSGNFNSYSKANFTNTISDFRYSLETDLFAGFYSDNRLIEILYNSDDDLYSEHSYLYSSYPIEDLLIDSHKNINVIERVENKLYQQFFEATSEGYETHTAILVDSSIASLSLKDEEIFYWTQHNDKLYFNKFTDNNKIELYQMGINKDSFLNVIMVKKNYDSTIYPIVTILKTKILKKVLLFDGKEMKDFVVGEGLLSNNIVDNNYMFYKSERENNYFILNQFNESQIQIFGFDFENNRMKLSNSIEVKDVNDYLVHQFYGKTYLVYSDQENNVVTFKIIEL